jgi:hypothetical protein
MALCPVPQALFASASSEHRPLAGALIDMLLTKFFNQGGAEHCAQWMSWFDKASGKQGSTALRTKLKVMQVGCLPVPHHSRWHRALRHLLLV